MRSLLLCSFSMLWLLGPAFGQEPVKSQLAPCGTAPRLEQWLLDYRAHPEKYTADRSSDTLWVALQIHLLAKDNGVGRFAPERLLNAFCRLNEDFAAANIRFYFRDEWNLLNSTAWYAHANIETGIEMMLQNKVPGAVNAYFVSDPAGNCGYNLPYGGVAMSHACSGASDHTWAHEVGHNLSLPHPFIGWEGKTYNFNVPTPTILTYDYTHFHAQPDTAQAPLDTALVELVDGSNCLVAADRFCDSRPDYLSYRWDCDAQNMSLVRQKDPLGAQFFSDGTLFMSYALDKCQSRFTDDEIAAMRANLQSIKADHLAPSAVAAPIADVPELLEPIAGEIVPKDGTTLRWSAVPNATKYVVQGSRVASFAIKDFEVAVADTFFATPSLPVNYNIYWRVRPFNAAFACTNFSAAEKFFASNISGETQPAEPSRFRLFPTAAAAGAPRFLEAAAPLAEPVFCRVFEASGRAMWQGDVPFFSKKIRAPFSAEGWKSGAYRAVFYLPDGQFFAQTFLLTE